MPRRRGKRAGVGAKATILSKYIQPKQNNVDKSHRSDIILESQFDDEKGKACYEFRFADNPYGPLLYGNTRFIKVLEEGDPEGIFDLGEGEKGMVKWKDSEARRLLYEDVLDGIIPLTAKDSEGHTTMELEEIYASRPEFAAFDFDKFSSRLENIRKLIIKEDNRAEDDEQAFEKFVRKHPVSFYSHKGYIQWQGSEIQALARKDLDEKTFDLSVKGGKNKEGGFRLLYNSRPEYSENFPFDVFSQKIRQEIKTSKHKHTLKVKGQHHKAS